MYLLKLSPIAGASALELYRAAFKLLQLPAALAVTVKHGVAATQTLCRYVVGRISGRAGLKHPTDVGFLPEQCVCGRQHKGVYPFWQTVHQDPGAVEKVAAGQIARFAGTDRGWVVTGPPVHQQGSHNDRDSDQ